MNVTSQKCARDNCNKVASFGAGEKRRLYCAAHAEKGMVSVWKGRRDRKDRKNPPKYGMPGAKRARICVEHAGPNVMNAVNRDGHGNKDDGTPEVLVSKSGRNCAHAGCAKTPSYGLEGARAIYCAAHAPEGTVDVRHSSLLCGSEGCKTFATYGVKGTTKRLYCARHASRGMVNVITGACSVAGCSPRVRHEVARSKRGSRCHVHAYVGVAPEVGHGKGEGDRRMKSKTAAENGSEESQHMGQKRKTQAGAGEGPAA